MLKDSGTNDMVKINTLKKIYNGTVVVNIPELTIEAGESIGLVGNNGAGNFIAKCKRQHRQLIFLQRKSGVDRFLGKLVHALPSGKSFCSKIVQ